VDFVYVNPEPTAVGLPPNSCGPMSMSKGREYEANQDPRFLAETRCRHPPMGRSPSSAGSGDVIFSSTALINSLD